MMQKVYEFHKFEKLFLSIFSIPMPIILNCQVFSEIFI